jgi:hypothetical protein
VIARTRGFVDEIARRCPMAKTPRDLADRMATRRRQTKTDDGYARETFTQPGPSPSDGEGISRSLAGRGVHRRLRPGGSCRTAEIEFTMKRLGSAD